MDSFFTEDELDIMELQDVETEEENTVINENDKKNEENISAGSFYVVNNLEMNAFASDDEIMEIMKRYRKAEADEDIEGQKLAATEMFAILHSYIIQLLNKNYFTYMMKYKEDMIASSYIGFCKGLKGFNPEKGRPSTWFKPFIQHECDAFINSQISHTSAHYASAAKKITNYIGKKKAEGKEFTDRDICVETGVSYRTLNRVTAIQSTKYTSLSSAEKEIDVSSDFADPEKKAIVKEQEDMLYEAIDEYLDENEKNVIYARCGLKGTQPLTAEQIEAKYGIKQSDVGKLYKSAMVKLKDNMKPKKKRGRKPAEKDPKMYVPLGVLCGIEK